MKTLKDLITQHDNEYGFDALQVTRDTSLDLPGLSIVIPYYETGEVFLSTLYYLYRAIDVVKLISPSWKYEIIVVDDGSLKKPVDDYLSGEAENLRVISDGVNRGRTKARNLGLEVVRYEKCLFMDSDIFVSEEFLLNHLRIHAFGETLSRPLITVGFFQFSNKKDLLMRKEEIYSQDLRLNDFRLDCIYGETWIGCEDDKRFIGKRFRIVEETRQFRRWPKDGFFGPWFLPNMVLGGFFMVDTKTSKMAGGFDEVFEGYGFTETSLPTKLIAGYGHYVVPVTQGGCLHIDDEEINVSRRDKDRVFREKHNFYFNYYLQLSWEQALNGYERS